MAPEVRSLWVRRRARVVHTSDQAPEHSGLALPCWTSEPKPPTEKKTFPDLPAAHQIYSMCILYTAQALMMGFPPPACPTSHFFASHMGEKSIAELIVLDCRGTSVVQKVASRFLFSSPTLLGQRSHDPIRAYY